MQQHPDKNNHGQTVYIKYPSKASPLEFWSHPDKTAIVIPDGEMPDSLNGIMCTSWENAPEQADIWEALANTMPLDEPLFSAPIGFKQSAGVVLLESDGRIWLAAPTNQYSGYIHTFPKGNLEGKTPKAAALAETFEETGLQVKLTGFLCDTCQ